MFETLRNAWRIPDLRKKLLYTLFMLLIYRAGSVIPTPFVDIEAVAQGFNSAGVLGMIDMFNGGALSQFTIFATGISPYITASIVLQLLTVAIPALERLQKDGGEDGRKKIAQYTRYAAIALSCIQSLGMILGLGTQILTNQSWYAYATVLIVQAAGAAFAMWLGERITERGIGNGISMLIFINIVSNLPNQFWKDMWDGAARTIRWGPTFGLFAVTIGVLLAVVYVDLGVRRIPVQYAKRVVGRKTYGGQSTHIPLKVNNSGVMPLIFAMTLASFPGMIFQLFAASENWFGNFARGYAIHMAQGTWLYNVVLALLVLFFTYFYSQISFNPVDISKNLQQYGGMLPGVRQGKPTSDYLARINNRLSLFSALFFMIMAVVPTIITLLTGSSSPFGATSILIMVSVALESSKQLESQMLMRHYKGFLN